MRSIAASIVLLIAFQFLNPSTSNYINLVDDEIDNLTIMGNPEMLQRGEQDVDELREMGTIAFAQGNYIKSILLWEDVINSKTVKGSDYFY